MKFTDVWKKQMAKETTTTFEVTVTHKGNKKKFKDLLKRTGHVQDLKIKEIDSETTDLGVINEGYELPDALKTLRLFLKDACEEAGLSYAKHWLCAADQYHIKYENAENIRFSVGNAWWARFIVDEHYRNVEIHIIPRGAKSTAVIDKLEYEVADPSFHEELVKLVKRMNRGYLNDRPTTN